MKPLLLNLAGIFVAATVVADNAVTICNNGTGTVQVNVYLCNADGSGGSYIAFAAPGAGQCSTVNVGYNSDGHYYQAHDTASPGAGWSPVVVGKSTLYFNGSIFSTNNVTCDPSTNSYISSGLTNATGYDQTVKYFAAQPSDVAALGGATAYMLALPPSAVRVAQVAKVSRVAVNPVALGAVVTGVAVYALVRGLDSLMNETWTECSPMTVTAPTCASSNNAPTSSWPWTAPDVTLQNSAAPGGQPYPGAGSTNAVTQDDAGKTLTKLDEIAKEKTQQMTTNLLGTIKGYVISESGAVVANRADETSSRTNNYMTTNRVAYAQPDGSGALYGIQTNVNSITAGSWSDNWQFTADSNWWRVQLTGTQYVTLYPPVALASVWSWFPWIRSILLCAVAFGVFRSAYTDFFVAIIGGLRGSGVSIPNMESTVLGSGGNILGVACGSLQGIAVLVSLVATIAIVGGLATIFTMMGLGNLLAAPPAWFTQVGWFFSQFLPIRECLFLIWCRVALWAASLILFKSYAAQVLLPH